MTCYDCIHCNACSEAGDSGYSCLKEDVSKCKHFKNKADFVEVVRCEKCKHLNHTQNNVPYCEWWTEVTGGNYTHCLHEVSYDGFCSYGERRDT